MTQKIFISYSHADASWLSRLREALAPFESRNDISVFDDTMIPPGTQWSDVISSSLQEADVAVVLASSSLFASAFVREVELPSIVEAAGRGDLMLVWAVVSACAWDVTPLASFQAAVDPARPLDQMTRGNANAALVSIARAVAAARTLTQLGKSLAIVDRVAEAIASPGSSTPRVVARQTGTKVVFEERGQTLPIETITGADIESLPQGQRLLIRALEDSMESSFERWAEFRGRLNRLTPREQAEYEAAGTQMCGELSQILGFVEQGLHKYLDDHYQHLRYACASLVK